ncbi:hypothetical protein ETD86_05780 [Nonomuraea turkmeniaca]|uniref:Uncharacterized protein n=1 Tax=Nonomuraea turkmeniaca TaxID=103838 RepID=A0A5S4FTT4_9ACTN|nr:hypothetical protein [Nonomuraea turkmeniaca]TMR24032.1 hypothetical protein ETD86_05780 [Nonomuraea turkmeniaca]
MAAGLVVAAAGLVVATAARRTVVATTMVGLVAAVRCPAPPIDRPDVQQVHDDRTVSAGEVPDRDRRTDRFG